MSVPPETLSVLPVPTVISLVEIVAESIVPPLISGVVNVLFVSVSVVSLPIKVSVDVGSVNVPVFIIVDMVG